MNQSAIGTALAPARTLCDASLITLRERAAEPTLCRREPDDSWSEWTFGEFAEQVARAAAGLRALGVGASDRIMLLMGNRSLDVPLGRAAQRRLQGTSVWAGRIRATAGAGERVLLPPGR
ncbi:AMP-binding protein [Streptomyces sp. NPDC058320]|uniref:AMP-binding protein n=1 Tax=unclassified Streptomyces TaxID=2593676 RepID=UPI003628A523